MQALQALGGGGGVGVEQHVSPESCTAEGGKVALLRVQLVPRFPRVS